MQNNLLHYLRFPQSGGKGLLQIRNNVFRCLQPYRQAQQPQVREVFYPGLEDSPRYAANVKQVSGFGGMISFEAESEAFARSVLSKLKLVLFAESLGGTESLLTYPLLQTHSDVPREEALAKGINERLLRLSVGLEAPEDIIADLEQAFAAAAQEA